MSILVFIVVVLQNKTETVVDVHVLMMDVPLPPPLRKKGMEVPSTLRSALVKMSGGLGTMPRLRSYIQSKGFALSFLDACLRGVAQVYLVNNPVSGAVILAGLAYHSWYTFAFGFLGCVISTYTAVLLGFSRGAIGAGLFGYNGTLVGVAFSLFHFGGHDDPQLQIRVLFPLVVVAALSTVVCSAFGRIAVTMGVPPLSLPFQVSTWVWMLGAQSAFTTFPIEFPTPAIAALSPGPDFEWEVYNKLEVSFVTVV